MDRLRQRIRELREARGIKQAALARAIKVPPQTLSGYELGPNKIPANVVPQLAKALDVSICTLYGIPEGHQVPAPLTLAEQLAQALGVEPARVEVNVYGPAEKFEPTRADWDTKRMLELWPTMTDQQRQGWLEFAEAIRAQEK